MSQTNLQIVTEAYQTIGVVADGKAPTPTQTQTGLTTLNDMLLTEAVDGLRTGWFLQANPASTAPLQDSDIGDVKLMLAERLAPKMGAKIEDPILLQQIDDAKRRLRKRSIRYFESDLSELSRPQGSPWGGSWL